MQFQNRAAFARHFTRLLYAYVSSAFSFASSMIALQKPQHRRSGLLSLYGCHNFPRVFVCSKLHQPDTLPGSSRQLSVFDWHRDASPYKRGFDVCLI